MSYPRGLDEYSRDELVKELLRRDVALLKGNCDYCGSPRFRSQKEVATEWRAAGVKGYENVKPEKFGDYCRFPERHGEIPGL